MKKAVYLQLRGLNYHDELLQASNYFSDAIKIDPSVANYYHLRGYVYYYLEKYQRAIKDWQKAAEVKPSLKEAVEPLIKEAQEKLASAQD